MIEAEAGIAINAPVEVVFDLVANASNEPAWLPGAQRVEKVTLGPVTVGTARARRGSTRGWPPARAA